MKHAPLIAFFNPFDYFYVSPTTRLYHEMLEAMPGVVTVNLENYADLSLSGASPDVVVFTPFVFLGQSREIFANSISRLKRAYNVPLLHLVSFEQCERYLQVFLEMRACSPSSVALMTEYDLHAMNEEDPMISLGQRETDYFLMSGPELYDLELHVQENISKTNFNHDLNTDSVQRGFDFIVEKQDRIVSLPHAMATQEFYLSSTIRHGDKSRRISVPGASYASRNAAVSEVLSQYPRENVLHLIDKIANRAGRVIPNASLRQRFLAKYFQKLITASRISFTCGSTSGYFVRKFIEIPAFGSCLCTFNYAFLAHLGLRPDIHYLPIKNVKEIGAYIEKLHDSEFMQHVIDCTIAAHNQILKYHSVYARQRQLGDTLKLIIQGRFSGSYWDDGEYKYRDA
tara:strand:+ start:69 stop:1265 length:1197 start_codon:yes stop_codon:yes gene_type:complete